MNCTGIITDCQLILLNQIAECDSLSLLCKPRRNNSPAKAIPPDTNCCCFISFTVFLCLYLHILRVPGLLQKIPDSRSDINFSAAFYCPILYKSNFLIIGIDNNQHGRRIIAFFFQHLNIHFDDWISGLYHITGFY